MTSTAANILRSGGLVAFPTETVYGLGADATNASAVAKIFAAKGRPATNPLIVHTANIEVARRYANHWPDNAEKLAQAFWPGPISLVVKKADCIAENVSAGRDTVGLRVPNHPMALQMLREFDGAVAAPSANRSNRISPTTAEHVRMELGNQVDLILDGGPCLVGIESTVLDLSGDTPTILRPGGISRLQIEQIIGPVLLFTGAVAINVAAQSPGQSDVHYSPTTPACRFDGDHRKAMMGKVSKLVSCGFIFVETAIEIDRPHSNRIITLPCDPANYARNLYAALRAMDEQHLAEIYIELPPDEAQWAAVRDRIIRATKPAP